MKSCEVTARPYDHNYDVKKMYSVHKKYTNVSLDRASGHL